MYSGVCHLQVSINAGLPERRKFDYFETSYKIKKSLPQQLHLFNFRYEAIRQSSKHTLKIASTGHHREPSRCRESTAACAREHRPGQVGD